MQSYLWADLCSLSLYFWILDYLWPKSFWYVYPSCSYSPDSPGESVPLFFIIWVPSVSSKSLISWHAIDTTLSLLLGSVVYTWGNAFYGLWYFSWQCLDFCWFFFWACVSIWNWDVFTLIPRSLNWYSQIHFRNDLRFALLNLLPASFLPAHSYRLVERSMLYFWRLEVSLSRRT